ncbi:MAG: hypothetical protein RL885_06215 [Planctomycetota bacterium]
MSTAVKAVSLEEIASPVAADPGSYEWKPVRHHFGIQSFGINANIASQSGNTVIEPHDESGTQHEELYYVARGHARFEVAGEVVDAPAGTFVFVGESKLHRTATAQVAGTVVIAIGGKPGAAFVVSSWEQKYW